MSIIKTWLTPTGVFVNQTPHQYYIAIAGNSATFASLNRNLEKELFLQPQLARN
jgi:hypothetical protein